MADTTLAYPQTQERGGMVVSDHRYLITVFCKRRRLRIPSAEFIQRSVISDQ
jgi:hypothetical protein